MEQRPPGHLFLLEEEHRAEAGDLPWQVVVFGPNRSIQKWLLMT